MREMFAHAIDACRPSVVDQHHASRSTAVDLLDLVRRAASDTGWGVEALAAHMECDKSHVSRLLSGDKTLSVERLEGFPPDVVARFAVLVAEQSGSVVVAPVSGEQAIRMLVAGLVGVLISAKLPARAEHMAKATWDGKERRRA